MKVSHGQYPCLARLNPPNLRETLAFGTVSVATRVVRDGCLAARAASLTVATKRRRATLHNCVDGPPLNVSGAMRSQIVGTMAREDLCHVPTRACATAPSAWVLMHVGPPWIVSASLLWSHQVGWWCGSDVVSTHERTELCSMVNCDPKELGLCANQHRHREDEWRNRGAKSAT